MTAVYIGLMSGTSMDGVDAVLARFGHTGADVELLGHQHAPFAAGLRQTLTDLNIPGPNELHRAALASNAVAMSYAETVASLLQGAGLSRHDVRALGAHGQTVRHQPRVNGAAGYTTQLLNGATLAELTGIHVICDFRSRDVAAGGQGAPLVPAFHQAMFNQPGQAKAVLNIGGFSNLTLLDGTGGVGGFDCGPGNVFLDMWCQQHQGTDYDNGGDWAAGGAINDLLLSTMLREPYFRQPLPKSTGRDLFNRAWLERQLQACGATASPTSARDIQTTLAQLTARTAAEALMQYLPAAEELLLCGGGALNTDLCQRLQDLLPGIRLRSTIDFRIPVMQVEAAAFAWLANRHLDRQTGNCPAVTGALGGRILGCHYPA